MMIFDLGRVTICGMSADAELVVSWGPDEPMQPGDNPDDFIPGGPYLWASLALDGPGSVAAALNHPALPRLHWRVDAAGMTHRDAGPGVEVTVVRNLLEKYAGHDPDDDGYAAMKRDAVLRTALALLKIDREELIAELLGNLSGQARRLLKHSLRLCLFEQG